MAGGLTREGIQDVVPVLVEVGEHLVNGQIILTVHQGQITKVQELKTGRRRDRRPGKIPRPQDPPTTAGAGGP